MFRYETTHCRSWRRWMTSMSKPRFSTCVILSTDASLESLLTRWVAAGGTVELFDERVTRRSTVDSGGGYKFCLASLPWWCVEWQSIGRPGRCRVALMSKRIHPVERCNASYVWMWYGSWPRRLPALSIVFWFTNFERPKSVIWTKRRTIIKYLKINCG